MFYIQIAAVILHFWLLPSFSSAIAQDEAAHDLIEPDWSDPFFSAYLRSNAEQAALDDPGQIQFTIPILGFDQPHEEEGDALPVGLELQEHVNGWPACAVMDPEVTVVPESLEQVADLEPGTWFTSSYDFECIQVVIEGDRNRPEFEAVVSDSLERTSGDIEIDYFNENGSGIVSTEDLEGRTIVEDRWARLVGVRQPHIRYWRGNLVYGVMVSCIPASEAFCSDEAGLRQLVERLVPIGGMPR